MMASEIQAQALANATQSGSLANYPAIFAGFQAKGIPADAIAPRENVFTFNAWKALGRVVRKGEHGVKVVTWVNVPDRVDNATGETRRGFKRPKVTTVFHVSQTEPLPERQH
jgi:hypothetical protein